jgi:hypothetical protein
MENIRDRLENRCSFGDTCTSQSADTGKAGSAGSRATDARVREQIDRLRSGDCDVHSSRSELAAVLETDRI